MADLTCLCRTFAPDGPDSARIGEVQHCPLHGGPTPNLVIALGKGKLELYDTKRFARLMNVSPFTLYRRTKDPARVRWHGQVYWSPQLLAASIIPQEALEAMDFMPITREDIEAGFRNLRIVGGTR